jgi:hypothetical protein
MPLMPFAANYLKNPSESVATLLSRVCPIGQLRPVNFTDQLTLD